MTDLNKVNNMEPNKELELYKLVTNGGFECRWTGEEEFIAWIYLFELKDFVKCISGIFGDFIIDLCAMLRDYDVNFERAFPKDEFKH